MNYLVWNSEYETGNEIIDDKHRNLFYLINSFLEAYHNNQHHLVLERTLEELKEYTSVHFIQEEELMRLCGYSERADHINLHLDLVRDLAMFKFKFERRDINVDEFIEFLKDWYLNHIVVEDMKIKPYLKDEKFKDMDLLTDIV